MPIRSLKEEVEAFTNQKPLSIARGLNRYAASKSFRNLPRHAKMHWRGLLQPTSGAVSGLFAVDERLLPTVRERDRGSNREYIPYDYAILCHCKPLDDRWEPVGSENRHPDVPDRLDLYLLLRHQFDAFAFTGETLAAIIRRTEDTFPKILQLRDWEAHRDGGGYRRSRVKSQLCRSLGREPYPYEIERAHAKTALRHLGLKLPNKPNLRRDQWPDRLRKLGLDVELATEIKPTRHVAMSTKKIEEYRKRYPEREG